MSADKTNYFPGMLVLVEDLGHDQEGRRAQDRNNAADFFTNGIIPDGNGLSNFDISVDGTTNTLINIGKGTAYSNGYRIKISSDKDYDANAPFQTTNGVCTSQSPGNKAIPLANYDLGQPNYVWLSYLETIRTTPSRVDLISGDRHFPYSDQGYNIALTTSNPPGNNNGLTNAVFLGTVFGQGVGNPLLSAPNGICQISRQYAIPQIFSTPPGYTQFVEGAHITNRSVDKGKLISGTITANEIADNTITYFKLEEGAARPNIIVRADGTGDYPTLSAAVAASSTYQTIIVEGNQTIVEPSAFTLSTNNVTILSSDSTIIQLNGASGLTISGDNCIIDGLKILINNSSTGAAIEVSGTSIKTTIKNCYIYTNLTNTSYIGIRCTSGVPSGISNTIAISYCNIFDTLTGIQIVADTIYEIAINNCFLNLTNNTGDTSGILVSSIGTNGDPTIWYLTNSYFEGCRTCIRTGPFSSVPSYVTWHINNNSFLGHVSNPLGGKAVVDFYPGPTGIFTNNYVQSTKNFNPALGTISLRVGIDGGANGWFVQGNYFSADGAVASKKPPISIAADATPGGRQHYFHGNRITVGLPVTVSWVGGTNSKFRDNLRDNTFETDS